MLPLDELCEQIGYQFNDDSLLERALTHRSCNREHNERLEFLGDAVLGLAIAHRLYHQFPQAEEGQMSRLRSTLVRGKTLASVARDLKLGDHLRLGAGELKSGGSRRDSILEDTMEALIGAIYLDSDFDTAARLVASWFTDRLANLSIKDDLSDAKSRLQEWMQRRGHSLPVYSIDKTSGKEHSQTFHVSCHLPELDVTMHAEGRSRKAAEQAAAVKALQQVRVES